MASLAELYQVRKEKMEVLQKNGMDPFTAISKRTHTLAQIVGQFETLMPLENMVTIAGRVMSIRGQGAIMFVTLFDGSEEFQVVLKRDEMDSEHMQLFVDTIDMGDFVECSGKLFVTARGADSLLMNSWNILTKSLAPLPDKWSGLTDDDERYRKRYLDILMDPELRELFEKKTRFWRATREFMLAEGFIEIETPTLEVTTGGAEARPFATHHNDYDMDMYLRISVGELWQKRALAAGFPRVFEIGRVYRNEGSSPEHLQEFTNIECYAAYMDYRGGIEMTERMWKHVLMATFGTLQFSVKGFEIDFSTDSWPQIEYVPYVESVTGINVLTATLAEMEAKLAELGVKYDGNNRERLMDTLWKYCRKTIGGPVWLIHHPKLVSPLAKSCPGNPECTQRCQLIVAGSEFANSFSELNDPIDQRARFELQAGLLADGDDEAMMPDWEFVEMLEHGMPPAFGSAPLGERLFAVLSGKSIREATLFPLVRPKHQ
jgi:lysyl-tRNA synthetase class 2